MNALPRAVAGIAGLRVLVVDDHAFLADMLATELAAQGCTVEAVGGPETFSEVLDAARRLQPDIVLLDYSLGDALGPSLCLIAPLRALGGAVLMLTGITNDVTRAACIEAGATGVVPKGVGLPRIIDAIERTAQGGMIDSIAKREMLLDQLRQARRDENARVAPFERLTRREREVLAALIDGRSAADIADDFFVSMATVRTQIRDVLQKLDVSSQLAAVALAHRCGWSADTMRRFAAGDAPSKS